MKATITISMDNAAFADDAAGEEVARILRNLADKIGGEGVHQIAGANITLRDVNGNTVGKFTVKGKAVQS
jgi:hypothetical protein